MLLCQRRSGRWGRSALPPANRRGQDLHLLTPFYFLSCSQCTPVLLRGRPLTAVNESGTRPAWGPLGGHHACSLGLAGAAPGRGLHRGGYRGRGRAAGPAVVAGSGGAAGAGHRAAPGRHPRGAGTTPQSLCSFVQHVCSGGPVMPWDRASALFAQLPAPAQCMPTICSGHSFAQARNIH